MPARARTIAHLWCYREACIFMLEGTFLMCLSYSQLVSVTNALSLSHFQGRIHQIEYAMEAVKQVNRREYPHSLSTASFPVLSPGEKSGNETIVSSGVVHIVHMSNQGADDF